MTKGEEFAALVEQSYQEELEATRRFEQIQDAAPDLLAACEAALEFMQKEQFFSYVGVDSHVIRQHIEQKSTITQQLQQAIKKARE